MPDLTYSSANLGGKPKKRQTTTNERYLLFMSEEELMKYWRVKPVKKKNEALRTIGVKLPDEQPKLWK